MSEGVIKRLSGMNKTLAVSIGIDGESIDRVTATPKPEIDFEKGMYLRVAVIYKTFCGRNLLCGKNATVLGKMLTARALEKKYNPRVHRIRFPAKLGDHYTATLSR